MSISSVSPKYVASADAAGSNQQIQYNNNGTLAGTSNIIINGTLTEISEQLLLQIRIDKPLRIEVSDGTIWTIGWWQASNGTWWLLGNAADVSSFTRADAEFYIPIGNITDVPSS